MPVIRVLPDPPSTTDPLNFSSKADAHVLALQDFTTDVNNFAADLEAVSVIAPSLDTIAANATTTQIWNYSHIQNWTGAPTITDLPDAPQVGSNRVVFPAAGSVFTNNANLIVQGGANYTVEAGDKITIYARTVSTFDVFIEKKNGSPVASRLPAGTIIDFAGSTAPSGYLACPTAQTNISRTTYAALFAAIGTTWGAGDGSTTFGMPWFTADYAAIQASGGNLGTQTLGDVRAHTHSYESIIAGSSNILTSGGGTVLPTLNNVSTGSTGNTANFTAGVRVLKCVKI